MCTFRRTKDFKISQSMLEITHRSKFWRSVVHPVVSALEHVPVKCNSPQEMRMFRDDGFDHIQATILDGIT